MKKILTLFAVVGLFAFSGCSDDNVDDFDDDTIPFVFDVTGVSFGANGEGIVQNFNSAIYSGDVILVYRQTGLINGNRIWSPIPESHYYDNGSLYFTYKFNFSQDDFEIYLDGFELNTIPNDLRANQTFRIVIVAGDDGINTQKSTVKPDYSDYNEVIKKYNIDDSNVRKLN